MKKFKIGFFVPSFPKTSETFIVNQIIYLIQQGHSVKIFSFVRNEDAVVHDNIHENELLQKTIYLKDYKVGRWERFLFFFLFLIRERSNINFKKIPNLFRVHENFKKAFNFRNFTKYKWIMEQGKFDIFHAHFGECGEYLAEMKSFGFYSRTRLVTSFHGYDLSPHLMQEFKIKYNLLFREGNLCIVNTNYLKGILLSIFDSGEIVVLPVGLDTEQFKRKNNENKGNRLIFVGRLVNFKGPSYAIKVLKGLVEKGKGLKNLHLVIIGEGEEEEHLLELAKDYKLESKVHFLGAMSQSEIIKQMEKSDIFILPGIHDDDGRAETQGLVIQEAQSMELPVLVSDAGGMKYGLLDGQTGFVIKEKDINGFIEKIEILLENPDLRKKFGKMGRKYVQENFDSNVLGRRLEKIYEGLSN